MNTRAGNILAGLIFAAIAGYVFISKPEDWPMALLWGALGVTFASIGFRRQTP